MPVWIIVLLGLVQGLTEFLPISSSGHLVILEKLFNIDLDFTFVNVILHLGTLLAVCFYYRKKLWYLLKNPLSQQTFYLIVATIPAVLFVLLCNNFINTKFNNTLFIGFGFLVTSVLLLVAETTSKHIKIYAPIKYRNSLIMGIAQALAVFPGLSRSGTTLAFGLMSGIKKEDALDFSFLMSFPIILGSVIFELFKTNNFQALESQDILVLILGFLIAFFTAVLGIKIMQKIVKKMKLWWFVPYLIILGVLVMFL